MAATGVSVGREVVICEDHLYKLRTITGLRTFSLNYKPWRRKYFILKKKKDDTLVLEYFDRQPMNKRKPKMQLSLYPKYRVEKITNSKNRAYVFEITTPEKRLCLSANEQRTMDMFVFFLQIQHKLVPQITASLTQQTIMCWYSLKIQKQCDGLEQKVVPVFCTFLPGV